MIKGRKSESSQSQNVYKIFKNEQRRFALITLAGKDRPMAVADLARELAGIERNVLVSEVDSEDAQRAHLCLHHVHIPKLDKADTVLWDQERSTVELTAFGEELAAGLDELSVIQN